MVNKSSRLLGMVGLLLSLGAGLLLLLGIIGCSSNKVVDKYAEFPSLASEAPEEPIYQISKSNRSWSLKFTKPTKVEKLVVYMVDSNDIKEEAYGIYVSTPQIIREMAGNFHFNLDGKTNDRRPASFSVVEPVNKKVCVTIMRDDVTQILIRPWDAGASALKNEIHARIADNTDTDCAL